MIFKSESLNKEAGQMAPDIVFYCKDNTTQF